MAERRYDDEEVAAIFRAATEGQSNLPAREAPREDGLTLADLQAIGQEVGIAPEAVAEAARTLGAAPSVAVAPAGIHRTLGLPLGVSRTVQLGRRLSDDEWEQLVVRLREVFRARGRTRAEGSLRQWTNGNLQVLLEPTAEGHRVRFSTVNGTARGYLTMSAGVFAMAALITVAELFGGGIANEVRSITLLLMGGTGLFAVGALRLPGWARLRAQQMDMLASELASATKALPPRER